MRRLVARGPARRRDRLRDLDARAAQRRERHPDAVAPRRRARAAGAHRRARRGRPRRVHAHQGHDVDDALAREGLGRAQRPAGDDRRACSSIPAIPSACSASSPRSRRRARAGASCGRQVGCFPLGMEFTLRHPYPLEAFIAWRPAIEAPTRPDVPSRPRRSGVPASAQGGGARPRGVPNRFSDKTLAAPDDHGASRGRSIAALVGRNDRRSSRAVAGSDPFDVFLDFGLDGELDAMFDCQLFNTDEDEVRKLLRHPQRRRRALGRRRPSLVPVRRRLRAAPLRPLGARARRPRRSSTP